MADLKTAFGGEPHSRLTTNQGLQIADDQNSLRVGACGSLLLEDFVLREKINHFDDLNGTIGVGSTMKLDYVARSVVLMAGMLLGANVQFLTVMATKMPFVGRG